MSLSYQIFTPALCVRRNYKNSFCRYLKQRIGVKEGDDDRVKQEKNKDDDEVES